MYRRGRPVDPEFNPDEQLYYRVTRHGVADDLSRILPEAFRSPDFSCNRGKYSKPLDVLLPHYQDHGVAEFLVQDIPERLASEGDVVYEFRVFHDPLVDNYAHSEVRALREGQNRPRKLPNLVKKTFRQLLSDRTRLIRVPVV